MSSRHPIIAFLAGLPQFEALLHEDAVLDLRSGCIVSRCEPATTEAGLRFRLNVRWPGHAAPNPHPVDAYKYVALQVQEASHLGFDLKLTAESAELAMIAASDWPHEEA
ncbi:hypothetical protein ACTJLC_23795 [Paraburkholderia sp. 22099]|jgi:hypothetical protein|uniref:hypothetical protein n=1 Tax=Paraburkholderia sp. 22099 TaxID=3453875 RepID=UPI003F87B99D